MKQRYAVWLAISGLLSAPSAFSDPTPTPSPAGLTTALSAAGPHASVGDHAQVVSRIVGTWDVEYTDYKKDGTTVHRTGEFFVGWIMDGKVVQDLWVVNPSGKRSERELYTDLIWFDAKSQTWRAAFVDTDHSSVAKFTGGPVGNDRFVLETQDLGSNQTNRWSFNEIRPDSFIWRDESSTDGGKTWKMTSEYHMKRRRAN